MNDFGLQLHDEDGRPLSVDAILGKMDPSEFLRLAEAVKELEDVPGWRFLEALIAAFRGKAVHQLTEGHLSGIEPYAHGAGFIKGLRQLTDVRSYVLTKAAEVVAAERAHADREES